MIAKISWWILLISFSYGACERYFMAIFDSYFDDGEIWQFILVGICITLVNNLNPFIEK